MTVSGERVDKRGVRVLDGIIEIRLKPLRVRMGRIPNRNHITHAALAINPLLHRLSSYEPLVMATSARSMS